MKILSREYIIRSTILKWYYGSDNINTLIDLGVVLNKRGIYVDHIRAGSDSKNYFLVVTIKLATDETIKYRLDRNSNIHKICR